MNKFKRIVYTSYTSLYINLINLGMAYNQVRYNIALGLVRLGETYPFFTKGFIYIFVYKNDNKDHVREEIDILNWNEQRK